MGFREDRLHRRWLVVPENVSAIRTATGGSYSARTPKIYTGPNGIKFRLKTSHYMVWTALLHFQPERSHTPLRVKCGLEHLSLLCGMGETVIREHLEELAFVGMIRRISRPNDTTETIMFLEPVAPDQPIPERKEVLCGAEHIPGFDELRYTTSKRERDSVLADQMFEDPAKVHLIDVLKTHFPKHMQLVDRRKQYFVLDCLAPIYKQMGDPEMVVSVIQRSLKICPDDHFVLLRESAHLGRAIKQLFPTWLDEMNRPRELGSETKGLDPSTPRETP